MVQFTRMGRYLSMDVHLPTLEEVRFIHTGVAVSALLLLCCVSVPVSCLVSVPVLYVVVKIL